MDALEAIRTRRCIKKYSKQPVEFEKVMAICEAGSLAPSAGNLQSTKFVVIRDKTVIRDALYKACLEQDCVKSAQVVVVVCADIDLVEREYGLRGARLYAIQNAAAAVENMLLAAHTLGIGANWVGAFNEERVGTLFKVPENARPQVIITLGYPAEKPSEKRLRHIDDVFRWDKYPSRYRDMHRTLLDLSEEWEMQKRDIAERSEDTGKKLKKHAQEFLENVQKKYREKQEKKASKPKKVKKVKKKK